MTTMKQTSKSSDAHKAREEAIDWKELALKLVGVVVEYDKLAIELYSGETQATKCKLEQLRELMRKLRDLNHILQDVLFIPESI